MASGQLPMSAYAEILADICKTKVTHIYRPHLDRTHFFDAQANLIALYNHDTKDFQMTGVKRSKELCIQVVQFKEKCVLNLAVDRVPERSYTFENPMSLPEALTFIAGEIRLEGNKWGPDRPDQPDDVS